MNSKLTKMAEKGKQFYEISSTVTYIDEDWEFIVNVF